MAKAPATSGSGTSSRVTYAPDFWLNGASILRREVRQIELVVAERTPTLNTLLRMHWRERKKLLAALTLELNLLLIGTRRRLGMPWPHCRIHTHRVAMGVEPDQDNLVGGGKLLIDALCRANAIVDDSPEVIEMATYSWGRAAKRSEQRTVITLSQLA